MVDQHEGLDAAQFTEDKENQNSNQGKDNFITEVELDEFGLPKMIFEVMKSTTTLEHSNPNIVFEEPSITKQESEKVKNFMPLLDLVDSATKKDETINITISIPLIDPSLFSILDKNYTKGEVDFGEEMIDKMIADFDKEKIREELKKQIAKFYGKNILHKS